MSPLYKYKAKQVIYFKLEIITLLLEVKEKINELFGEKLHANPLPEYGFTNVIFFFVHIYALESEKVTLVWTNLCILFLL